MTNAKQDSFCTYINNTIIDSNKVYDNPVNNADETMENISCIIRGNRTRRRGRMTKHMKSNHASHLKMFSTNAAGLVKGKLDSLKSEVASTKANIVTIQESHCRRKGKVQLPNFVTFESIRTKKGGGTIISAHENVNPKLIEEYSEDFEILVVEVETEKKSIRIISGYGPQENLEEDKRLPFFLALEKEVERAELAGKSVIIELDANSKLGEKYIRDDPHKISPNGQLLAGVIERHALYVANGSDKCKGRVTRRRVTKHRIEESSIDIVLFSQDMLPSFVSLIVDEDKRHVLTRITKTKKGVVVKESDHNVLQTEFEL